MKTEIKGTPDLRAKKGLKAVKGRRDHLVVWGRRVHEANPVQSDPPEKEVIREK